MNATSINIAYLLASILFIFGLKGLTHPRTAVRGNLLSAVGMLIAVVVTLFDQHVVSFEYILAGVLVGSLIGAAPVYMKTHSMGEFVYDWSWSDAAGRFGLEYYPKLVIAAPFSGGLSLGPAAPVAVAQAALAVHTTRRTGRLTARWLVDQRGRGRLGNPAPTTLMRRLVRSDTSMQRLLAEWPQPPNRPKRDGLLP